MLLSRLPLRQAYDYGACKLYLRILSTGTIWYLSEAWKPNKALQFITVETFGLRLHAGELLVWYHRVLEHGQSNT